MPFNENRFHYSWHWHWNFGTGDMGNDGAHQIDMARWALGVETPTEVSGTGRALRRRSADARHDAITFKYPEKILMFEMRIWTPYEMEGVDNGVAVYGADGMVQIGGGRQEGWVQGIRQGWQDGQLREGPGTKVIRRTSSSACVRAKRPMRRSRPGTIPRCTATSATSWLARAGRCGRTETRLRF